MIRRSERGKVLVLELAHGKVNAMDIALLRAIIDEMRLARDHSCGAVVLTSDGGSFCAGVDLPKVVQGGRKYLNEFLPLLSSALLEVYRFEQPVVAAINGHAIAGGFLLACACDLRVVVADRAKLGVTELLVGVPFPLVALELLRAVAGRRTSDLVYSGRLIAPTEALALGLVDELSSPESLLDRAVEAAQSLVPRSPEVFALTKARIQEPALRRMARDREAYDARIAELWSDPETLAAMRRFVEQKISR